MKNIVMLSLLSLPATAQTIHIYHHHDCECDIKQKYNLDVQDVIREREQALKQRTDAQKKMFEKELAAYELILAERNKILKEQITIRKRLSILINASKRTLHDYTQRLRHYEMLRPVKPKQPIKSTQELLQPLLKS
jgi:hypothetical protein